MNLLKKILIIAFTFGISPAFSQATQNDANKSDSTKVIVRPFDKKFKWGFNLNMYWSSITGSVLPNDYFAKPSVGLTIEAEFRPVNFIGISIGAGYQQLGSGIYYANAIPVTGLAPDSTHRQRLRFNTIIIPLAVSARTPGDILFKGCRLGISAAFVPTFNTSSHAVFVNIEPTIRVTDVNKDVSSDYFKNDLLYQFGIGPEIETGTGILKIQFIYTHGTSNVYAAQQGNGLNNAIGFRFAFLF